MGQCYAAWPVVSCRILGQAAQLRRHHLTPSTARSLHLLYGTGIVKPPRQVPYASYLNVFLNVQVTFCGIGLETHCNGSC